MAQQKTTHQQKSDEKRAAVLFLRRRTIVRIFNFLSLSQRLKAHVKYFSRLLKRIISCTSADEITQLQYASESLYGEVGRIP